MGDYHSDLRTGKLSTKFAGEQRVRLLGPFHFEFDTAGLADNPGWPASPGIDSGLVIPAGAILISIHLENPVAWDAHADNAAIQVHTITDGDESGPWEVARYYVGANNSSASPFVSAVELGGSGTPFHLTTKSYRFGATGNQIRVFADAVAGATQGEADIYALIAEPVE